ncbi:MAG: methyltransferase domain-containing protein, partial [Nitrosopumilus sp.]|nr:methyltransferase domain-containing protein [Nitrosopumilus sp.]
PISDASIDVVVSFETVEHLNSPEAFLSECIRVIKPGGLLILSTPNCEVYNKNSTHNPFHIIEFSISDLLAILHKNFKKWQLYTQYPISVTPFSIRSLVASNSSWLNLKGFWKLRRLLRKLTFAELWSNKVNDQYRNHPADFIINQDDFISKIFNPYIVRKWYRYHKESSRYFLVVIQL